MLFKTFKIEIIRGKIFMNKYHILNNENLEYKNIKNIYSALGRRLFKTMKKRE